MSFPPSKITFTIPSIYDKTQLDCRIFLPSELSRLEPSSTWCRRGAIVAHPYAPLGGCYDDPVVGFVSEELLEAGYVVGTFNFRGAGDSDGRTSWTAKPELADYVSIYCFLLYFLCILETGGPEEKLQGSSINQPLQTDIKGETEDPFKGIKIILGGYSYGSLIASHLPTLDVITNLFKEVRVGSALYEICSIAEEIFVRWRKTFRKQMGIDIPRDSDSFHNDGHGNLHMKDFMTPLSTSYLLISPILPPISQLLTVFSTMSLNVGSETSAQGKHIPCPKPADQLRTHRTLAIYGNQDTFTSARKLQKWSEGLARALDSNFRYREIDKAGHFWREDGVEMQARRALRDWLHFGE